MRCPAEVAVPNKKEMSAQVDKAFLSFSFLNECQTSLVLRLMFFCMLYIVVKVSCTNYSK